MIRPWFDLIRFDSRNHNYNISSIEIGFNFFPFKTRQSPTTFNWFNVTSSVKLIFYYSFTYTCGPTIKRSQFSKKKKKIVHKNNILIAAHQQHFIKICLRSYSHLEPSINQVCESQVHARNFMARSRKTSLVVFEGKRKIFFYLWIQRARYLLVRPGGSVIDNYLIGIP